MKATGVVIENCGKNAKVRCVRESACSSCHNCEAKGECHVELIFGNQKSEIVVEAQNAVGAKVDDRVELVSASAPTLFVSLMIFVMPIVITAMLYFLFNLFVASVVAVSLMLLFSFVCVFVLMCQIMNMFVKKNFTIEISRILEGDD